MDEVSIDSVAHMEVFKQGAESRLYLTQFLGSQCVVKERFSKKYRHPELDFTLTKDRQKSEIKAIAKCRQLGIPVPVLYFVDQQKNMIYMHYYQDSTTVRDYVSAIQKEHLERAKQKEILCPLMSVLGRLLAIMHSNNVIHGDLTTSNFLLLHPVRNNQVVVIDFGLSYVESKTEDKGVDLYVLERAFLSTHPNSEELFSSILEAYKQHYGKGCREVLDKLDEVRLRGRKRSMVG